MSDKLNKKAIARFRNLNWEKAKTFYVVARMGTFSKAAKYFHIAQSAVSRQIIDLEQALEQKLFVREPRGVRLTRKGEELYSIVETTFSSLTGFTRNTHAKLNKGKKRQIKIAATQAIAAYVLDTHILAYNKENPHLIFELVSDDSMTDIVLNDIDIAIRPFNPEAQDVYQEPLFTLEKKLFASQSYLDKYGEPQTLADLKNHHLLSITRPEESSYADVNWILNMGVSEGKSRKPVYASNAIESVVKAAKQGMGIMASYDGMEIIKDSKLKNVLSQIKTEKTEQYFTYPTSFKEDDEILALKSYLQKKLKHQHQLAD